MRSASADTGSERTIRGSITAAGARLAGAGFICTKTGVGLYTVRFVDPFKSTPSVVAGGNSPGGYTLASVLLIANDLFQVAVRTPSTNAGVDGEFAFIATGSD